MHDLPSILALDAQKARASAQAKQARELADRADYHSGNGITSNPQSSFSEGKDNDENSSSSSSRQDSSNVLTANGVGAGASLDEFSAATAALSQSSTTGTNNSNAAAAQAAALAEAAVAQWRLAAAARHEQWLTLDCRGSFSARMAHDWVTACLPDVPPRLAPTSNNNNNNVPAPAKEEKDDAAGLTAAESRSSSFLGSSSSSSSDALATLCFLNAYTGAELCVEYGEGIIRAKADSASAVSEAS